jgi:hypothetical protein
MSDRAARVCCLHPTANGRGDWSLCRSPFRAFYQNRVVGSCHADPVARQGGHLAGAGCAARPIVPARSPIAPGPVRSVEAGGPRFLDCLPTIVDRIVAVGGIVAAVIRAGVVAAVVRAAIIAICAARDRATD